MLDDVTTVHAQFTPGRKERSRARQLLLQESDACIDRRIQILPTADVYPIGLCDLIDRTRVMLGVIPDVESGQPEAERVPAIDQRPHELIRAGVRTMPAQACGDQFKILDELPRAAVSFPVLIGLTRRRAGPRTGQQGGIFHSQLLSIGRDRCLQAGAHEGHFVQVRFARNTVRETLLHGRHGVRVSPETREKLRRHLYAPRGMSQPRIQGAHTFEIAE